MKIERNGGDDREAQPAGRPLEPKSGAVQSVVNAFDAALRQFRQRERSAREESGRRAEEKPKTAPARPDSETQPAAGSAPSALGSISTAWLDSASIRPFPLQAQPSSEPQMSTPAPRDIRRRRPADEPEASGCIEVVHPQSGARFLLSQQDGVWLLSVSAESGLDAADLETLKAQFAECGLGPVDILIV